MACFQQMFIYALNPSTRLNVRFCIPFGILLMNIVSKEVGRIESTGLGGLFQLIILVFGLRKNLSSPVSG